MTDQSATRVRQVVVTDPIAAGRHDYTDAFEARLPEPDTAWPEAWLQAGLSAVPPVVEWITGLLGVRRGPESTKQPLDGWRVVESTPEVVHLETSLPMMQVVMVARKVEPTRRILTTVLDYKRPLLARIVFAVIGPAHRRTARRIVEGRDGKGASDRAR